MSRRMTAPPIVAPLLVAALLVATPAAGGETSIGLLGGYASEVRRLRRSGDTFYGWGIGTRVEHRFEAGFYLGGAFVMHRGTSNRASDDAGVSTYRFDRHATYVGPEMGWDFRRRSFFLRPYAGAGAWLVIARTAVRNRELRDDGYSAYVMPGLLAGYRGATWHTGLDLRVPISTGLAISEAAPTVFLSVAFVLPR